MHYKFSFAASGRIKLKVNDQLFKGRNTLIKSDLSKYSIGLDGDFEEFAIIKNVSIDIVNLDNVKNSITGTKVKGYWIQDYFYTIHFSIPHHRISEFRRLLIKKGADHCDFDDYPWSDFPSCIAGLRAPNYLEEIDERSHGNFRDRRSEAKFRLL